MTVLVPMCSFSCRATQTPHKIGKAKSDQKPPRKRAPHPLECLQLQNLDTDKDTDQPQYNAAQHVSDTA
jgi:hypothetical protein